EIVKGLSVGEDIVTSGQFLIDSEASLKASIARMSSINNNTKKETSGNDRKKIIGTGVLKEIMASQNKINIAHDPIPALSWPDMIMDFDVKASIELGQFNKNDKVKFELEKSENGYVIKALSKFSN
ncbi:MAG: copper-binding protein, partial [Gammaproteobacteria bacterium]|nr:copper-binding protein [Gammaproteobacteria bacterium]